MTMKPLIAGIDLTTMGTTAIAESAAQCSSPERMLQAHDNYVTQLLPGHSPTGRRGPESTKPFRVELGTPSRITRQGSRPLQSYPGDAKASTEQHQDLGMAAGYLARQVLKGNGYTAAVVCEDNPSIEAADTLIKQAYRNFHIRCQVVPWSVAGAWSWLLGTQPANVDRSASIAVIRTDRGQIEVAIVNLIRMDDTGNFIPLRDYELSPIQMAPLDVLDSSNDTTLTTYVPDVSGLVCTGPHAGRVADYLISKSSLATEKCITDHEHDHAAQKRNLLAHGSIEVIRIINQGDVPYYITAPQIELLLMAPCHIPNPTGRRPRSDEITFWTNCLEGVIEEHDGHKVVPANRQLKWKRDTPVEIYTGRTTSLRVAFNHRDVRTAPADVPEIPGVLRATAHYGAEYTIGTGRPKVYIEVNETNQKFEVDWAKAEESSQNRDDVTTYQTTDLHTLIRYGKYCLELFEHKNRAGTLDAWRAPDPGAPPDGYDDWLQSFQH